MGAVTVVLLALLLGAPAGAGIAPPQASARVATASEAAARPLSRKLERRRLARALRRHPRSVLRQPNFLRRAAVAGLVLPLTLRLRPGTQLGISWVAPRFPLDSGAFPAVGGEQSVSLTGRLPMEIDFGAGPGYGGPGNLQGRMLVGGSLASANPLRVADVGGCAGTPPAFVEAAVTAGGAPLSASPVNQTWTDMNPFSGAADGYLDLNLRLTSRLRESLPTCGDPTLSGDYDLPASSGSSDPWSAPVRILWNGRFRIAPAITSDGAVRFGRIDVDPLAGAQSPTTGNIWGCAARSVTTGSGLPLGALCPVVAGGIGEDVSPVPFAAQFTVKSLSADVLLGKVPGS